MDKILEQQLLYYLGERNIRIDSLEADSIREGAEWGIEKQKAIDKEIAFNVWKTKFHVGEFYEGMRADFDALWDRLEKSLED